MNNAVKYAPGSNKIIVHISQEGTSAKIAVQDFGKGIPTDKIPHLLNGITGITKTAFNTPDLVSDFISVPILLSGTEAK